MCALVKALAHANKCMYFQPLLEVLFGGGLKMRGSGFLLRAIFSGCIALASAAQADEPSVSDWSCACLTYDGGTENCYMFASITGPTFSFGAFETSGSGTFSVERDQTETVVTGRIVTGTDQPMTVIIAQPHSDEPALVFIDERKPGGETFTASCTGKL